MTRINSAIPVEHLTDEHLLAEHREIKRIPACFGKTNFNTLYKRIPDKFCLGPGHVTFFFNKLRFTYDRYLAIHAECLKRGFDVTDYRDSWFRVENRMYFDHNWRGYTPTAEEKELLIERISLRIIESSKPYFHYHGEPISKLEAIKLLTQDEQHFGTS